MQPNKRKTVAPLISHHSFNVFFSITTYKFLAIGSKLRYVPSIFACLYFTLVPSLLCSTQALQKPCQENFGKFQGSSESSLGSSEKDHCFFIWNYKRGKLVSYFLNNTAKTCLYGPNIS